MAKNISAQVRKVRAEVKCYGFWRKTSTAKTKRTIADHILGYLDETSKPENVLGVTRRDYQQLRQPSPEPSRQLLGIDYLTKEEKGKVSAFGFLRDDILRLTGNPAHQLTNNARVMACNHVWMARLGHKDIVKVGHKFVFSLDPRFCELMAASGRDIDAFLVQGARTVMRKFQEKHYPGDRLGYLIGIHHDRKHIHGHILLFPYTESGRHLKVTDSKEDKRFREFRRTADQFVRNFFEREFENPQRASDRTVDKVTQVRLLTMIASERIPKELTG